MTNTSSAVTVRNLAKSYGEVQAVAGIDFEHAPILLDGLGVILGGTVQVGQTVVGGDVVFLQLECDQQLLLGLGEGSPLVIDEAQVGTEFRGINPVIQGLPVDALRLVILVELDV